MKLNDRLLNAYVYNGVEYRIDMTFDNVLDIFDVLADDDLSDFEKANLGLLYLFDGEHLDPERATIAPEDAVETWNDIFENYISVADKEVVDYDLQGNPMPKKATKKLIDIEKMPSLFIRLFDKLIGLICLTSKAKCTGTNFRRF